MECRVKEMKTQSAANPVNEAGGKEEEVQDEKEEECQCWRRSHGRMLSKQ